ncbi:MAG: ATP-binding protein [Bryobacteraceae bacterium]|nr:ATP-binding protein [Bryobacteraceae bacterium]
MSASPLASELRGIPNPFRSGITRDAWDPEWVDVPEIHAAVSDKICGVIETIRQHGGSRGVLVFGQPGSGKTHLLNRIRRWCLDRGAVFSGFRLQCAPQTLWRHLRREFVSDLLQVLPDGSRQLDRVLESSASGGPSLDFALFTVLNHWREGRFLRECEAWLRGDLLPESILGAMGLPAGGEMEEAEDEARRVLMQLIALAAPRPVVLALDQVEAMQSDSSDPRGLRALGSAVAALRDESRNLVVVTCVQTSFLKTLEDNIHKADLARMRELKEDLHELDIYAARLLVKARLDAEPALRGHRFRQTQPLWPFTEYALTHLLVPGGQVTPRRLIYAARDLFEQLREGREARPARDAARFLAEEVRARIAREMDRARWDGDEFLLDGVRRLLPIAGWRSVEPRPAGIDIAAEKADRRLLLVMFNRPTMRGAPRLLQKLAGLDEAGRLRLLRAQDLPLGRQAPKTAQLLADLEQRGARLVRISREAMAALEACRKLLADAAAGDLHMDGETLGREFVEDWLRSHLPPELEDWLASMEPGHTARAAHEALTDALIECIRQEKVISVEEAAQRLGCTAEEVRRCAYQGQDAVAAVGQPPQVLYERLAG